MRDATPFVGIPYRIGGDDFTGCDCYGLARLYLREAHGIALPRYPGVEIRGDHFAVLAAEGGGSPWRRLDRREARDGDVVLIDRPPRLHCGVMIDRRRILHVAEGGASAIERVSDMTARARIRGVFRWAT